MSGWIVKQKGRNLDSCYVGGCAIIRRAGKRGGEGAGKRADIFSRPLFYSHFILLRVGFHYICDMSNRIEPRNSKVILASFINLVQPNLRTYQGSYSV